MTPSERRAGVVRKLAGMAFSLQVRLGRGALMATRDPELQRRLRSLPSVTELLARPELAELPEGRRLSVARRAVEEVRARLLSGSSEAFSPADLARAVAELSRPELRRVLNATGVILHTNLGRAPLAEAAIARVAEVARGYCNLEFDLDEGERGSRYAPVVELLCELTGAEDALVVNNCAAAVLLVLGAHAAGREVIVSRGELVEIGGGFRIPDVMAQSGATLVEVGTTNRTRAADYERALGERTALLAKIHRSNFAVVGFTEEATAAELVALGKKRGVPVYVDLGSGSLAPLEGEGLTPEPTVREVVASGADLVSFSGDKLLGGPQAGIVVGTKAAIAKLREHPLNRALRIDKLTVAALEATLGLYRDGNADLVPARRMLDEGAESIRARAERLRAKLAARGVTATLEETVAQVGGGSMPLARPRSFACALRPEKLAEVQERLRRAEVPVIARVSEDRLLLDARCLSEADLDEVARAVAEALAG